MNMASEEISIRGMPVKYTAILVDGKKQSGRETQPSGGGYEKNWLSPLVAIECRSRYQNHKPCSRKTLDGAHKQKHHTTLDFTWEEEEEKDLEDSSKETAHRPTLTA